MARLRNRVEEGQSRRLLDNVDRLMEAIDREHQKALGRVRDASAVIDDLQRIEREMRLSLPASIRNMQDIGNLLKGDRG
jgi:cell wall assembly regulator SMI1